MAGKGGSSFQSHPERGKHHVLGMCVGWRTDMCAIAGSPLPLTTPSPPPPHRFVATWLRTWARGWGWQAWQRHWQVRVCVGGVRWVGGVDSSPN